MIKAAQQISTLMQHLFFSIFNAQKMNFFSVVFINEVANSFFNRCKKKHFMLNNVHLCEI